MHLWYICVMLKIHNSCEFILKTFYVHIIIICKLGVDFGLCMRPRVHYNELLVRWWQCIVAHLLGLDNSGLLNVLSVAVTNWISHCSSSIWCQYVSLLGMLLLWLVHAVLVGPLVLLIKLLCITGFTIGGWLLLLSLLWSHR